MSDPLADENRALRAQLAQLLQQANHNQQIWQRHQAFDLQLIAAPGLRELLEHLFRTLPQSSSLDVVTLALLDPDYEIRRVMADLDVKQSDYPELLFLHHPSELGELGLPAVRPQLGGYIEEIHGACFPDPLPAPASVALVPLLRNGRMTGWLNFGSADRARFDASMHGDFLAHMASVVAVCLENVINHERLQRMGLTDALTGVHNRRFVERRLLEEIERARRHSHALSCLYIDIDHFKQINDRCGHHAGDQVLRDVAASIKAELRLSDTLGRFGGEEFVAVLAEAGSDDAIRVAERIRAAVSEQTLLPTGGGQLRVTVSIGVASTAAASMRTDPEEAARELLEHADRALYQAKYDGRNRVVAA